VGHDDAAFGHHGRQVAIAQTIGDVPPDAQFNDISIEPAAVDAFVGARLPLLRNPTPTRGLFDIRFSTRK
jgi:hypothetical protein